jgi:hypothetical protein
MLILSFGLLALALSPSGLLAAGIGEQCSSDSNCPFGSPCLQSIANKYCSAAGMLCGWSGTSGYQLNQKETSQQGKAYVCTIGGFKLDLGEKCSNSETCASGACVTAISNKYCSNFGATCGWPSTSGQMLGTEKQYDGKTYVCTPSGFELAAGSPTQAAIDQIFAAVSSFTHAVMSQLDTMKSQAQQAASQTAEYWGSCPSQSAQTKYEQVKSNRGDVNAAHQDAVAMRNQALAARTNCKSTFSNSPLCDATYNDLALHGAITALESARSVLDQALNAMKSLQCVSGCSQTATLQVPVPTIQDQGEWSLTAPGWVRGEVCTGFDLGSFDINTSAFATGNLSQLFQTQAPGCTRTERFALCTDWDLEALLETLQRRQRVSPEVDQITVDLPNRPLSVDTARGLRAGWHRVRQRRRPALLGCLRQLQQRRDAGLSAAALRVGSDHDATADPGRHSRTGEVGR